MVNLPAKIRAEEGRENTHTFNFSMQFLIGKKTDKKCRKNHNWQLIVLFVIVSVAGASSVRIVGHVTVTNGNIYQTFTTIYIFCGK